MAQVTPKHLAQALIWIHCNEHNESGIEYNDQGCVRAVYYRNYHDKMRVLSSGLCEWVKQFHKFIRPNTRQHDDRMYALTPAAKQWLRRNGYKLDFVNHP